ncbi:MAG: EVE domain-containing protein [Bacteroidia bacterium]|nr:EVE domain-containing protein [Bacteroidia bacterium]
MNYWLIKSEPFKYSWDQMVADKSTYWDGVRSYAARIFLKEMKVGDICLFYHSNEGLEIVGLTIVEKEHYQDPTTDDDRWVAVDVKAIKPLNRPITLKELKADDLLKEMRFVRQSRLSVAPVTKDEFDRIMTITETTL